MSAEPSPAQEPLAPASAWHSSLRRLFEARHLPLPLIVLPLLFALTHAVYLLLIQPAVYWLDASQIKVKSYASILVVGPLLYGLGVAAYLLVIGLLLVRLRRPLALALSIGISIFHIFTMDRLTYYSWPPFLFHGSSSRGWILQESFSLLRIAVLAWALLRLSEFFSKPKPWERWIGRALAAGWIVFLAASLLVSIVPVLRSQQAAQGWRPLVTAHRPPPRRAAALAYDPNLRQAVMFGGESRDDHYYRTFLGDTWIWDGQDWTLAAIGEVAPEARSNSAFAYDEQRGVMVLYGGYNQYGRLADVWEWDGAHWVKGCPVCNPEGRSGHRMLYDPQTQNLMMVGGFRTDNQRDKWFQEMWCWNGTAWGICPSFNLPPKGRHMGAVYEEARDKFLFLFSTQPGTWTYSQSTWKQLYTPDQPPPEFSVAMAYDPVSTQTLTFGGWSNATGLVKGTWLFDGSNWRKLNLPLEPAPRGDPAVFYDAARESVILFGGEGDVGMLDDTWEFQFPNP